MCIVRTVCIDKGENDRDASSTQVRQLLLLHQGLTTTISPTIETL